MSTQISTFNFKSNPVRIETVQNEPYFCLTDVCSALAINNANSSRFRFNEDGIHKMYSVDKLDRKNEITFINEPNLYRIIFRSNKAEAVEFQNWVFEEVLPQIRKTGRYSIYQPELELPRPDIKLSAIEAERIAKYLVRAKAFAKEVEAFHRKLHADLGIPRYIRNDIAAKGYDIAHEFNTWINPFIEQALPQIKLTNQLKPISNV